MGDDRYGGEFLACHHRLNNSKNGYSKLTFYFARGSKTFKHPPPVGKPGQNQYDYTRVNREAQRAALECQRGSPQVRNALYDSL